MFDSLPETKGGGAAVRSSTFSTVVMAHLGILLAIAGASVLAQVSPGDDPPPPAGDVIVTITEIPMRGDDPDAGGSSRVQEPRPVREPERPQEREVFQPEPPEPEPAVVEADPFAPAESQPPEVPEENDPSGSEEDSGDGTGGNGTGAGSGTGSGDKPGIQGVPWGVLNGTDPHGVGTGDDSPMVIHTGVEPPVIIVRVEPDYPEMARRARIQGEVILESVIGTDGRVESLRTLKAAHPFLDDAARKAVSKWIYRPATQNGRRVKVYLTIRVEFRLN